MRASEEEEEEAKPRASGRESRRRNCLSRASEYISCIMREQRKEEACVYIPRDVLKCCGKFTSLLTF